MKNDFKSILAIEFLRLSPIASVGWKEHAQS